MHVHLPVALDLRFCGLVGRLACVMSSAAPGVAVVAAAEWLQPGVVEARREAAAWRSVPLTTATSVMLPLPAPPSNSS